MSLTNQPKALFFDVFGTLVDWRTPITNALTTASAKALNTRPDSIPKSTQTQAKQTNWASFAQEWRTSYMVFTSSFDPAHGTFTTVDEHHHTSLKTLLETHNLQNLFTEPELQTLSLQWHFLTPWPDSPAGMAQLNQRFTTSTLSNGNTALLTDLAHHASLPFHHLLGAEDFKAYKPAPAVYRGAAERLGLRPDECAMVATHISDLACARKNGLQTVYVERKGEASGEDGIEEVERARREGWVDMWVAEGQGGLLEVARRFRG